jgi:hypothetical protein
VPFIAAEAKGRADALAGRRPAAAGTHHLVLPPNADGKPLSKTVYREQMAASLRQRDGAPAQSRPGGQAGFAGEAG